MTFLTGLALRNLLRHKLRTTLTLTVIVAGIGLLILGEGFITGLNENIIVSAEDALTGHITARPAGYPTVGLQHPVDSLLELDDDARAFLDRETEAWTERTLFMPQAVFEGDSLRVRAFGYDPQRDPVVFPRERWKIAGAPPADEGDEILVSTGVAKLLGLETGDPLVLQLRTHQGAVNALQVTVSGVLNSGNTAFDRNAILVPAALTHRLVNSPLPSHVSMRLGSRRDAEAFKPRLIEALGPQAEAHTWDDETRDLIALQEIRQRSLRALVGLLMALAAFGMANTILMAAHERVREIGTLRALGMTHRGVLGLFLLEGGVMGLIGGLLGAAWGGALTRYWALNPIDMSAEMAQEGADLAASPLIYTAFEPSTLGVAAGLALIVALISSVYPARVASRMAPAEAVRAET